MPTQTYPYLELTDGTTTCTFANGSGTVPNYPLARDGWAPKVTRQNRSEMGNPYERVLEEIPCTIIDTTAAAVYARLSALVRLLDQAGRFARGENVTPVLIKYAPQGSTVASTATPYQAMVLGVPNDFDNLLSLPANWNAAGNLFQMEVTVRFVREGLWLCSTQSANAAADNGSLGGPIDLTAAVDNLSPTKLSLTNVFSRSDLPSGFLALTDTAGSIVVVNAEGMATGVLYTSVADGGNYALNTNILRYSPADTTLQRSSATSAISGFTGKQIAVYINARISSGSTSYSIRVRFGTGATVLFDETPLKAIPATSAPQWFCVGVISLQYIPTYMDIVLQASAGSGQLDIDSVVIVDVGSPNTKVIGLDWKAYTSSSTVTVTVDHRLLTGISPLISDASVALVAWGWRGDVIFETKLRYVYWLLMRTGGASTATRWRTESGAAVHSNTVTATRSIAYLVPQ